MASLVAQPGAIGVVPHPVPCISMGVQNSLASKTKMVRSTFQKKSSNLSAPCGFFHAKSRTRIGCWNVRSLGFLSDQGAELCSVIHTMKTKDIDLLVLFESRWPGRGVCTICGTTILHSGTMSSCTHPWCGCLPLSSSKGCLGGFWQCLPALCLGGLANSPQSAIYPT